MKRNNAFLTPLRPKKISSFSGSNFTPMKKVVTIEGNKLTKLLHLIMDARGHRELKQFYNPLFASIIIAYKMQNFIPLNGGRSICLPYPCTPYDSSELVRFSASTAS